jgi:hypothetical protein
MSRFLLNPKVHYRVHESPPLVPILRNINPVHMFSHWSIRYIVILFSHLQPVLPSGVLPSSFPPLPCVLQAQQKNIIFLSCFFFFLEVCEPVLELRVIVPFVRLFNECRDNIYTHTHALTHKNTQTYSESFHPLSQFADFMPQNLLVHTFWLNKPPAVWLWFKRRIFYWTKNNEPRAGISASEPQKKGATPWI